jgi:hypothetical protein
MATERRFFTSIVTTRRMTSGELSKHQKVVADLAILKRYGPVFGLVISLG